MREWDYQQRVVANRAVIEAVQERMLVAANGGDLWEYRRSGRLLRRLRRENYRNAVRAMKRGR